MTTIGLSANDQLLAVTLNPKVTSGQQNTVDIHVEFSDDWDRFAKSAVFFTSNNTNTVYEKVLTNGECIVPAEVMSKDGILYIGVRGVNSQNNEVKTTSLVKYKISEGSPSGTGTEVEPTPDIYQQLLSAYGKTDNAIIQEIYDRESAIATEKTERQTEIAVERNRITNLATLSEGSTTGDAELIDARVGYDGKLYGSLGEAIRTQVGDVYARFEKGKNKINKIITGEAVASNGTINVSANFQRTDYILLPAGTYVYSNHANAYANFRYAVYGLDKTFEFYRNGAGNVVITLDDVKYVVISDSTNRQNLQLEEGDTATTYEPYSERIKLDYLPVAELNIPIAEDEFNAESENVLTNKAVTKRLDGFLGAGKNLYNNAKRTNDIACSNATTQIIGAEALTVAVTGHSISDWIKVEEGEKYILSNSNSSNVNYRIQVVGDNNILVADFFTQSRNKAIIMPLGATKIRFSNKQEIMDTTQFEKGDETTDYVPYIETVQDYNLPTVVQRNWFEGKTILFNGDSITIGTGLTPTTLAYPYLVCKELNAKIINNAIGGSTLASNPSNETRNPLILRYDSEVSDEVAQTVDLVYIAIGTNDWAYQYTPVGTMEDRVTTTFYGALHLLCQGLLNKYAGKPIIFATPIKRRVLETHTTPTEYLRNGKTLKEYGEIIKEVCDFYSIPVLDMYSECCLMPFIDEQRNLYFQETSGAVHPNSEGAKIMARRVIAGLRSIVC